MQKPHPKPNPKKYDLADLLNGITKMNRHKAVEFGLPQGKEAW